jgi:hypothetical protein
MSNIYKYLTSTETKLSPVEEALYQEEKKRTGLDDFDYDMRGYYKEFGSLNPISSSNSIFNNGHFVDTYKKPNHITFSTGSKYNGALTPNGIAQGGNWIENKDNSWIFQASPYNLTQHSPSVMRNYFNRVEQGNKLDSPIWGQ